MTIPSRQQALEHGAFIVDRQGTILGFDEGMERLTGWPASDVVGRHKDLHRSLGGVDDAPLFDGDVPETDAVRSVPLTLHCADGRRVEVEALVQTLPGPGRRVLVRTLRVLSRSPRRRRDAALRRDPLTGFQTAEAFVERLTGDFQFAASTARPLAVVLADVDRLRTVNDRLGREAGDEVLRRVADILRVAIDEEERLCRFGDDDFAILLPDAGRGEARQVAAGLRSMVERYPFFADRPDADGIRVTLSLGAASYPADADNSGDLLERARDALDEARSLGRNRVWCYVRRPRVPVQVPVYFDGSEALLLGYSRDLSPSGIFVQTAAPVDIGMRCALAFPLPGLDGKVHVIGRVVRTVPPESEDTVGVNRVPGMGVEFERFGGHSDRRAIEAYLHRNEGATLRPEGPRFSV